MTSPLLALPGAVAGDGIDAPVAAHYGSFNGEQRTLEAGDGFVDLSHRDVLRDHRPRPAVPGCTTSPPSTSRASRRGVDPGAGAQPAGPRRARLHGHRRRRVLHRAHRARPGAALAELLDRMRFMSRVEVADGRRLAVVWRPARRRAYDLVPRDRLDGVRRGGRPACGLWAYEALRIARGEPRLGLDTDHRTIPNEVGWIGTAVHLDKGCYRGQETVARVHTLGRPPRRLTLLHLDGSENRLPAVGSDVPRRREGRRLRRLLGPPPRARPDRAGAGQAQRAGRRPALTVDGLPAGAGGRGRPRGRPARAPPSDLTQRARP